MLRTFPKSKGAFSVNAGQNTPIVKRMFRQGPDHISTHCSSEPVSSGRIPGAAYHRWPVWGWRVGWLAGQEGFVWREAM